MGVEVGVHTSPTASRVEGMSQYSDCTSHRPPISLILPPVEAPPVEAPPVEAPPVKAPPVKAPPVEAPHVEAPPVEAPHVEAPPVKAPPVKAPPVDAVGVDAVGEGVLVACPLCVLPSGGSGSVGSIGSVGGGGGVVGASGNRKSNSPCRNPFRSINTICTLFAFDETRWANAIRLPLVA